LIELYTATNRPDEVKKWQAERLAAPQIGGDVVVLAAEHFDRIRDLLEDEREKAAWAGLARRAADRWGRENPYAP
jgi:hypothetical protein